MVGDEKNWQSAGLLYCSGEPWESELRWLYPKLWFTDLLSVCEVLSGRYFKAYWMHFHRKMLLGSIGEFLFCVGEQCLIPSICGQFRWYTVWLPLRWRPPHFSTSFSYHCQHGSCLNSWDGSNIIQYEAKFDVVLLISGKVGNCH
jgi:hypothetical protein